MKIHIFRAKGRRSKDARRRKIILNPLRYTFCIYLVLRVHLKKASSNLKEDCDIMIDQIRAIDNKRLLKKIGELNKVHIDVIKKNISIVLDL